MERVRGHRQALTGAGVNLSLDEFITQVRATNLDQVAAELEQTRETINRLEDKKTAAVRELDQIDNEFKVREAAESLRAASGERLSAAARVDELTREYLEQRIGAALLAKAMARYREKNQDPLLKRAGEYFSMLTCGAYASLAIDDVNEKRVLCGVRADEHLTIEAMSDGTRDPLYLALRLAYIEDYCDKNTPCPVILDDVLMAFDDVRTAAALHALQTLARKTQVLVFTHHEHHVALANRALGAGGCCLHELASVVASTNGVAVGGGA
jgi:uncharacterized protein YhaN